jgi:hypothetical protein
VDLEAVIQELRAENPELSESEARELAGLAVQEARAEGEGATTRDLAGGALGAPELGGGYTGVGPGHEMTPEEKAFAEKVTSRGQELGRELYERGLTGEELEGAVNEKMREEFGEQFKEFQESRPVGEAPENRGEKPTQEQIERYREMEHSGHEAVERPTYEHEQPTVERSEPVTREYERPPMEQHQQREYTPPQG